MDYEQKLEALQAIGDCSIRMRAPGNWYVSQSRVGVKDGSFLAGSYGNGKTPEAAVLDHWKVLVDDIARTEKYLVIGAMGDNRRAVRWNGFMWQDVAEDSK